MAIGKKTIPLLLKKHVWRPIKSIHSIYADLIWKYANKISPINKSYLCACFDLTSVEIEVLHVTTS